jgi:glycosyltransferase involved in cell wall biosynthesis
MVNTLSMITPVILAYNEEPNLPRTLSALSWAKDIVLVDSGSVDRTLEIARSVPNVRVFTRAFDRFDHQWRFAIDQTAIASDYVLALDADMWPTAEFLRETEDAFLARPYAGAVVPLRFGYYGRPLFGTLCRPQLRLFRKSAVRVSQPGHGHEFAVDGPVYRFAAPLWHEDHKPLERWTQSQLSYSKQEHERMASTAVRQCKDIVRTTGWMPVFAAALAYFRAGGPLCGKRALRYAWERAVYECLLSTLKPRSQERAKGQTQ